MAAGSSITSNTATKHNTSPAKDPIAILIADDQASVRQGLRMHLSGRPGISIVGEASNGREALEAVERLRPAVVLMDLLMPVVDGAAATAEIRRRFPEVNVLVLSSVPEEALMAAAMQAGAAGHVRKDSDADVLLQAIRAAATGA